jgi:RHS repeat-associated protein
VYIGDYYEQTGSTVRKYYYAGGRRVAMRENGTLNWLLTDHLGSTAITAYSGGGKKAEIRYKAWGEDRYTSGTTPTTYRFTGQRLEESLGLYYYRARWYDPALGRFVQPDTIVPDPANPQDLNRYAYVRNNPLLYTDPTGRYGETPLDVLFLVYDIAMLIVDVGDIIVSGPSPEAQRHLAIDVAATALDVACLLLPGATGGGPAARAVVGGATEAVRTGEMAKRLGQMGIKAWQLGQDIMYFAKRADGDLPGAQRSSQGSEFTERSFRRNLQRAKGPPPKWMQEPEAHHMLPRSLEDLFKQIDPSINIHDPRWGGWVERYEHRRWSRTYQLDWEAWLRANPEATLHDLIQKAAEMAHKYGINWAWQP